MSTLPKALLISGYTALSQKYWANYVVNECCDYSWSSILLPPRYFSWRMRGAPLSAIAMEPKKLECSYDLVLATSSVDLATLQSIQPTLRNTPSILYFHENQFAYPKAHQPQSVVDWQMVSVYSAIRADKIIFNTDYNRTSFLTGVKKLFKKLPDLVPISAIETIEQKCHLLPVPIRAPSIDFPTSISSSEKQIKVLWNHRWEWDKSPELLLEIFKQIKALNLPIQFVITGQQFRTSPAEFDLIHSQYSDYISHIGYVESKLEYEQVIQECSIVLSTATHEFQGISVLEAVSSGCVPLLPNRLSYEELFNSEFLYQGLGDLKQQASSAVSILQNWLRDGLPTPPNVSTFFEANLSKKYQALISV